MTSVGDVNMTGATLPATVLKAFGKVPPDAILLLEQDHREVEACFAAYQEFTDKAAKQLLRDKICMLLKAHMQVEEQIFYPRAQTATGDGGMVDHAMEEHTKAKQLINKIETGSVQRDIDAVVEALRQAVEEHVAEEETELFPKVRQSDLQWYELGAAMAAQRTQLLQQLKAGREIKIGR
jgi:iron-sulfur cluster repair protein YtfE (RIC family)